MSNRVNRLLNKIKMLKHQFEGASTTDKALKKLDATVNISADAKVLDDLPVLRARSEYMYNNYNLAKKIINTTVNHESNYKLESVVTDIELKEAIDKNFKLFSKNVTHDKLNLDEFFDLYKRTISLTGDCFIVFYNSERGGTPFYTYMEIISSNRIFTPNEYNDFNEYKVRNGVQLSDSGEPIGFYALNYELNDVFNNQNNGFANTSFFANYYSKPLKDFTYYPFYEDGEVRSLHLFKKEFPGQTRGIPKLATAIKELHTLYDYRMAEWTRRKIASCISLYIKTNNPVENADKLLSKKLANMDTSGMTEEELTEHYLAIEDEEDARIQGLSPGGVFYLNTGEEISTLKLDGIEAGVYESWLKDSISNIASGVNIPKFLVYDDWADINYSSSKSGFNTYKKEIEDNQQWDKEKLVDVIYEKFINELITLEGFNTYQIEDINLYAMYAPHVEDVDTAKETQSTISLIDKNLLPRSQYFSARGQNFEEVCKTLKYEKDLMAQYGIIDKDIQLAISKPDEPTQTDE